MSPLAVRLLSGVFAAIAALIIWVIAVPVLGIELSTTDYRGQPIVIGPVPIIIFSIGPALAGWALLALLERFAAGPAKLIWTIIAVVLLVLSMLPVAGMPAGAAITLGLMHLAVGAVIIVAMRATSPTPSA